MSGAAAPSLAATVEPQTPVETRPGPVPRVGARAFLGLDRTDLVWLLALVTAAFVIRAASPIFPNILSQPSPDVPITGWGAAYPQTPSSCVPDVPVGPGGSPTKVCGFVFDEVYFPVDAAKDLHQVDYFDPEPPLAKLLMAPPIAALGFDNRWSWRLSVIIAGSLLVGLVYMIARRLRRERFFAIAAALFMCVDGLALVESRTGVIDTIAVFFVALIYYVFLLHWQARTRTQWRATLWMLGLVLGLGFGAKLTALAPLVVIAALVLVRLVEPGLLSLPWVRALRGPNPGEAQMWRDAAGRRPLLDYAFVMVMVVTIFGACFSRYLTYEHHSVYAFTACDSKNGLQGDPQNQSIPVIHAGPLIVPDVKTAVANIAGQTSASITYHRTECRDHPYQSRWYTWPVMAHPVLFYVDYSPTTAHGASEVGWISDFGNPAVWWLALPALLFCVWYMTRGPQWWRLGVALCGLGGIALMAGAFHVAEQSDTVRVHPNALFLVGVVLLVAFGIAAVVSAVVSQRFVPAFIVLGYMAGWMMWVFGNQDRILFFYHMLGSLLFICLGLAYALTALRRLRFAVGRTVISFAPVAYAACITVFAAFVFFYPMWTGAPLQTADHDLRLWLPGW
jgi:hypothetical protein